MTIDILLSTSDVEKARCTIVKCMKGMFTDVAFQVEKSKIEYGYAEFNDGLHWWEISVNDDNTCSFHFETLHADEIKDAKLSASDRKIIRL